MEFSTDITARAVSENNLRKKETKQNAEEYLKSEEVRSNLIRTVEEGGSVGRRLSREIQRFESTGRISNWLANQTTKAELNVGRQRQQAFNELVSSVSQAIESPVVLPFGGLQKFKPELPSETTGIAVQKSWDFYIKETQKSGQEIISYTLGVRGGTISSILPENWDDEFVAQKDILYYGIATAKTDGQFINGAEIKMSSSLPTFSETTENAAPDEANFIFGMFKNGVNINLTNGSDIRVAVQNVFATEKTGGTFGSPAYNLWYRIQ